MTTINLALNVSNELQNKGKLEAASLILRSILEVDPIHAHALHLSGIIAYQTGKLELGVALIKQAIDSDSKVALFHSNLGEIYRQLNNVDASIQCGERAVQLDPQSATALSNLGIAYYDAKNYDAAKECHQRALTIDPHLGTSLNNLGSIYKSLDKTSEAINFYKAAIAAAPHFVEPLNNLGALLLQQQEFKQAYDYLHQAIRLAPPFADAHCNLGLALLGLDKHDESRHHFETALRVKPNYAECYFGIAKIHLDAQDYIAAEQYIYKAIELKHEQVEFHQLLAEIYHAQGNNTQALHILDQALSTNPTLSSLYISKGSILMEMGKSSDACEQFLKVTQDSSLTTRVLGYYSLLQLQKIESNNLNFKSMLTIANNIHEVSPHKREYVYFALGKCYDDMGEYEKAFTYFSKGCNQKRKGINYHITDQIKLTDKIIRNFNKQTLSYLRKFANPSALPIFIVGMPRSGTTLIEQILAAHPDVCGAGELKYLNNLIQSQFKQNYPENIREISSVQYQAITDQYLKYLSAFSVGAPLRITDKMPQNFMFIGIIHALFPNAKIIHVKRNAIDTCLSCYTKLFKSGHPYSYDLIELGQYYLCYERIMNHWRNILPPNAWFDIHYESMIQNFEFEAQQLVAFCDLGWDPVCLDFHQSKRNVRTASFMQVRQPIYKSSINRWRRFEKELAPLIRSLENLTYN